VDSWVTEARGIMFELELNWDDETSGIGGAFRGQGLEGAVMEQPRPLAVSVVTDDEAFFQLAEQWDRLVERCASSTPFQTHAWLSSWWRCYGATGRLRVVVVHAGTELVAAVALFLSRHRLVRILSPVGVGLSDFCDVLVADTAVEDRAALVHALGSATAGMGGWDVIDLPEVRTGAAALELAAEWSGESTIIAASTCLELPVQDLDSLIASLPRSDSTARSRRRAKLRKLDEAGITSREVTVPELPLAISEFHRLHLAQWEGRGVAAAHKSPRFPQFLTEALPLMVRRGQAVVVEFGLAGELVAVGINVVGRTFMGQYLAGVAPSLRRHVEVSTLLLRKAMELALQRETPVLSFLRGREDYKLRWRPELVLNRRVVLGRAGSLRALAYLTAVKGRAKALPWLRKHAPWLKSLRTHARRQRLSSRR
jgi:CelD/BcsL family acetyltransferase involved in cellulose biosynthesis